VNLLRTCSLSFFAACVWGIGLAAVAARCAWGQDSLEAKYISNVRQVTSGFEKAGEGYFSPDAATIVYQAIRPEYPFYQIFTQPLEGGTPHLISTGRGRTTCAYFSPDGKQILFASSHLNPDLDAIETQERAQQEEDRKSGKRRRYAWDFDPYMDIYVCDLEGQNRTRLTSEYGYDAEGAYSRDGKLIAYCHAEETPATNAAGAEPPPRNPDIYVMNADGSGKRRITSAPGYDGGPFISPDGQWIAFRTDRLKPEYLQIHVIGVDGQNEVVVTNQPDRISWAPYWHPTKPWLIWTSADHSDPRARPNYDLFVMPYQVVDGKFVPGEVTRITDSPAADVLPVFSPDGNRVMWTSTRTADGTSQLFIADVKLPQ
jgi:TolB protein